MPKILEHSKNILMLRKLKKRRTFILDTAQDYGNTLFLG